MNVKIILQLLFITVFSVLIRSNADAQSVYFGGGLLVGGMKTGSYLQAGLSFERSSKFSIDMGLGVNTFFRETFPIPTSNGTPIHSYSSNPTLFEVTQETRLGFEIDANTFFDAEGRGIYHLEPKKDYHINRYFFVLPKFNVLGRKKHDLNIGIGLGLGLTDDSRIISWYSGPASFLSPPEIMVAYEIAQKLRYISYSIITNIDYSFKVTNTLSMNINLGHFYTPYGRTLWLGDMSALMIGVGISSRLSENKK